MNFSDITLFDYLEILVEWVFEYFVFATALFWTMKKRPHFLLRFILGILGVLAIAYPLAIFYHFFGDRVFGRTLVYFLLFVASIAHHFLCYEGKVSTIIVVADLSYLIQNMVYKLFVALITIINFVAGGSIFNTWSYKIVYYLQFAAQAVVVCLTLIPAARDRLIDRPLPRFVIAVSAFTVIVSILLSATQDIYIQTIAEDLYDSPSSAIFILRQSGNLAGFMLDGAIVIMFFAASYSYALRRDISDLHYLVQQSAKQYEISQQTIDSINIKCHDMKHRINQIVGGALPEDTIRDINDSIAIYDALIDTGNKALDVIITEKNLTCESRGIAFTKTIDGKAVSFLTEGDLFALFGNLLDNAIEAVSEVQHKGKRYINLSLRQLGEGIVRIECMNYYEGDRVFRDGLPKSTKGDDLNHGFGMRSIRQIVQKYSGEMSVSAEEGVFSVAIVFYRIQNAF